MPSIKGLQKTTLVDFPPYLACTVFISGCNFRCGFCHNKDLVEDSEELKSISEKEIFEFLEKRKNVLSGVCITGGEPTLYKSLATFIKKIKDIGYNVKLDTNGYNPGILKDIIKKNILDYIAMDIKAPLEKYHKAANVKVDTEKIRRSIDLIKDSDIGHEFRITAVPGLHEEKDFESIGNLLKNTGKIAIQQFTPKNCMDEKFNNIKPFKSSDLERFKKIFQKYIKKVEIRNI